MDIKHIRISPNFRSQLRYRMKTNRNHPDIPSFYLNKNGNEVLIIREVNAMAEHMYNEFKKQGIFDPQVSVRSPVNQFLMALVP